MVELVVAKGVVADVVEELGGSQEVASVERRYFHAV